MHLLSTLFNNTQPTQGFFLGSVIHRSPQRQDSTGLASGSRALCMLLVLISLSAWAQSSTNGTTVAGGNGAGSGANQLNKPTGVYVDGAGAVYMVDESNHRIQKWAAGATSGTTVAGGNGAGSGANQLNSPFGVYVDGAGAVYVADRGNNRIQKWAAGATSGTTVAGGNGAGSGANQLTDPAAVYVDGVGAVYVADSGNNRIQKWAAGATSGTTVAGGNGAGSGVNQLNLPYGVYVDGAGAVYVADLSNNRIQRWAAGATSGTTVAGGNGRGSGANQLDDPTGVFVDGAGAVYVAEQSNDRIQKWAAGATSGTTVAGGNGRGSGANQLNRPTGVYGAGAIYVADQFNDRIQRFTSVPATVTALSPTRNAIAAATNTNVTVTLSQPPTGPASALTVWSQQAGGKKAGTATVSGNSLTFNPTTDFKPGEVVFATATRASGLAKPLVYQFTTAAAPAPATFSSGSEVAVGGLSRSLAAVDVDGDGDLDFLTANAGSNTVSVRLNDGNGSFSSAPVPEVPVGDRPQSIAAADVDGDGDLDFLTANAGSRTVSVRLNDGNGSFSSAPVPEVPVVGSPMKVVAADMDGDGDLDFLTASDFTGNVSVRLNNGNGTFSNAPNVAVPAAAFDGIVADVDNDGDLDILVTNNGTGSTNVSIRLNNGDGTFSGGSEVAVGVLTFSIAAADVDGDGDLDFLAASYGSASVSVRLNDGSGNFSGGSNVGVGSSPRSVAVGDVDGDGDLDFLVANQNSASVSVRLNDGSGNFSGGSNIGVGTSPYSVAVGDVDGDGDMDILAANNNSNTVSVRLNQLPPPTITGFAAVDNTVCVGSPISFTATVSNVTGAYAFTLSNGSSTTMGSASGSAFSQSLTASGNGPQNFTLSVGDNGFQAMAQTSVTVNALPLAGLTNNGPLTCAQTSVTLTASGGSSYTFSVGATQIGTSNRATISSAGSYSVSVGDANGCVSTTNTTVMSNTAVVTVSNPTTSTATINTPFSQSFTASGGVAPYTYSLASGSLPPGLSLSTAGVLSGTPTQGGSFTLVVRGQDANGCADLGPAYILTVNATPTITGFAAVDNSVCVGSPISFTATVGNVTGAYAFTLSNGTSPLSGTATGTAFSQVLTASGSGTQSFTLTIGDNGFQATAQTTVTVNSLPIAGLTNNGPLTCAQTSVTLTASGGSSYTFTNGSGQVLAGSGNTRMVSSAGSYSVTVGDASGCVSTTSTTVLSNTAVVMVNNPATSAATINMPFSQSFTASGGVAPYTYSLASGSLPAGLSLSSAGVLSGTPSQGGSFTLVVRGQDANGCADLGPAYILTVNATPTIAGFAAVDNTVCVGSPISFTATVGNVTGTYAFTLSNGTSPLSGTATGTAFSRSLVASGNGPQNFTLTVGDNGFQASATTGVTVNALPLAGLTNNGPLTCAQTSVTLTASGGSSYTFTNGSGQVLAGSGNTRMVSSAGSYSVSVGDANGCVSTTSTTVMSNTAVVTVNNPATSAATINMPFSQSFTASGGVAPYTYSLASGSLPAGLSLSTAGVLSGTPSQGGSFTLVVRGQDANGCADLGPAYILTVNATPTIAGFAAVDNTVCVGSPISFTATVGNVTGAYAFTLSNGTSPLSGTATGTAFSRSLVASGNGPQNFTLTVGDNGFQATAQTTVTVNSLPIAGLTNNAPLTCAQTSVTLTASGGSSYTFTSPAGSVLAGSGNTRTVSSPGSYSVTVSDANGCVSTTSTTVSQDNSVPPASLFSSGTLTCATTSVTLTANTGAGLSYRFSSGATQIGSTNQATVSSSGTYSVTVTGTNGCSATAQTTVTGDQSVPTASLTNNGPITCSMTSVTLTASGGTSYRFSSGATQIGSSNQATVTTGGLYSVTVTNAGNGCSGVASTNVSSSTALPTATISGNTTVTSGGSTTLTASGGTSQTWSTGQTTPSIIVMAGTYSVTVTNASGCSSSTSVTVSTVNSAPVATANANQTATVGVPFAYTVNAFTDADTPNQLTYSASINPANGFSFDPNSRVISGTPSMSGVSNVTVTATDPGSLSASTSFTITVNPPPPTPVFSITSVTTVSCQVLSAGQRRVTFNPRYAGLDGSPVSFSVVNEMLPTTNPGPYTLNLYTDNSVITLQARQSGASTSFAYNWLSACSSSTANTPPTVANPVPPQSATVGVSYTLSLANVFTDAETPNGLVLSVTGLPAGLNFVAPSTISGTPSMSGVSTVTVTATDPGSMSASTSFTITVSPAAGTPPPPTGTFSITSVQTISCQVLSAGQRRLTFNPQYAGLNGAPVSFSVVNELAPTTNPGPYSLDLYTDNPVITLRAVQSGISSSFAYNWLSACSSSTANTPPTVANPVSPQSATVGVGYTLSLANVFTDAETPNQLTLSVSGLPAGLNFVAPSTISGTPSMSGVSTVTVTATDPGSMSASTSFTITVNPAGATPPPSGPFSITGVQTISCEVLSAGQRRVNFNPQYAGLDGSPVSFSVVNEMLPTTSPGPYVLNLYTDNPVISLRAVQSGVSSSFSYGWLAACNPGARLGVSPEVPLKVVVLGNPVVSQTVEVEVWGAQGQPLRLHLTDERGHLVSEQSVGEAGMVERQTLNLGQTPAGVLLLRVSTFTQSLTLKLLKVE